MLLGAELLLGSHFVHNRPGAPDTAKGMSEYFNIHGAIVYISSQDNLIFNLVFWTKMAIIAFLFIIIAIEKNLEK